MTVSRRVALATALLVAGASTALAQAEPKVGAAAPTFTGIDTSGKPVSLGDYKGKTVVLEWTNDGCPFVKKHYGGDSMQALQKKWTSRDIVWLTVVSSPPGEQGHVTAAQADKLTTDRGAKPTAVLLDPKGEIARAYKATVTPHMFVVKPDGVVAYMGGIDDRPSTKLEDLKGATNFVDKALTELADGKAVSTTTARPYGCAIKYTS